MSIENKEWSKIVADSLRDAEMEVSDQMWSRIESDIPHASIGRRGKVIKLLSAIAAVVAIGVCSWIFHQHPTDESHSDTIQIAQESEIEMVEIESHTPEQVIISTTTHESTPSNEYIAELEDEPQEDESQVEEPPVAEKQREPEIESERPTEREAEPQNRVYNNRAIERHKISPKPSSMLLAMNMVGTGISSSSVGNIAQPSLQANDLYVYNGDYTELRILDKYRNSDISHRVPFSVALSAGYYLSNRFLLVGGVSYTALVSDLTKNSSDDMVQRLQYIGIPIRVDYNFLKSERFVIYGGLGGGVEYLLSARIDDTKINEYRWQYSLSSAVGVEYKLTNWFGLYAEPEVAYYLKETKLETIRTESPLTFNMRFGLRFTL